MAIPKEENAPETLGIASADIPANDDRIGIVAPPPASTAPLMVEQEKLDPSLSNYLRALARTHPFTHDLKMDRRRVIAALGNFWPHLPDWSAQENEVLRYINDVAQSIPIDEAMPDLLVRVSVASSRLGVPSLPEPDESAAIASIDTVDGVSRRCIIQAADAAPSLDDMNIHAGLMVLMQPAPAGVIRIDDTYALGSQEGLGLDRYRDRLLKGEDEVPGRLAGMAPEDMNPQPHLNPSREDRIRIEGEKKRAEEATALAALEAARLRFERGPQPRPQFGRGEDTNTGGQVGGGVQEENLEPGESAQLASLARQTALTEAELTAVYRGGGLLQPAQTAAGGPLPAGPAFQAPGESASFDREMQKQMDDARALAMTYGVPVTYVPGVGPVIAGTPEMAAAGMTGRQVNLQNLQAASAIASASTPIEVEAGRATSPQRLQEAQGLAQSLGVYVSTVPGIGLVISDTDAARRAGLAGAPATAENLRAASFVESPAENPSAVSTPQSGVANPQQQTSADQRIATQIGIAQTMGAPVITTPEGNVIIASTEQTMRAGVAGQPATPENVQRAAAAFNAADIAAVATAQGAPVIMTPEMGPIIASTEQTVRAGVAGQPATPENVQRAAAAYNPENAAAPTAGASPAGQTAAETAGFAAAQGAPVNVTPETGPIIGRTVETERAGLAGQPATPDNIAMASVAQAPENASQPEESVGLGPEALHATEEFAIQPGRAGFSEEVAASAARGFTETDFFTYEAFENGARPTTGAPVHEMPQQSDRAIFGDRERRARVDERMRRDAERQQRQKREARLDRAGEFQEHVFDEMHERAQEHNEEIRERSREQRKEMHEPREVREEMATEVPHGNLGPEIYEAAMRGPLFGGILRHPVVRGVSSAVLAGLAAVGISRSRPASPMAEAAFEKDLSVEKRRMAAARMKQAPKTEPGNAAANRMGAKKAAGPQPEPTPQGKKVRAEQEPKPKGPRPRFRLRDIFSPSPGSGEDQ